MRASFLRFGAGCAAIATALCAWSCASGLSDDEIGAVGASDGGSLVDASVVDAPATANDDAGNPAGDDAGSPADDASAPPDDAAGGGGEDSGNGQDAGETGRDAAAADSGSDAGEPDAGHADGDAGAVDAGRDAGEPDAGSDAGYDAGEPDAAADAGCTPAAVVVNEVQTTGVSSDEDEWVELFNPSSCAVDISSWTLKYLAASGTTKETLWTAPSGTKLAALGYGVVVGTAYSGSATPIGDLSGGLAEAGGGVAIYEASGTLLDSVGYGTATNAFVQGSAAPEAPAGRSIARTPNGVNTHDNAADFSIATTPTPGAGN